MGILESEQQFIRSRSEGKKAMVGGDCVETLRDFQGDDVNVTTALLRGFTAAQIVRSSQFRERFEEYPPKFEATGTPQWAPPSVTRGVAEWGCIRIGLPYGSIITIKRAIDGIVEQGRQFQNA